MVKCRRCGLLSPDKSVQCQCGFLFGVDDERAVVREHDKWISGHRTQLWGGLLLMGLGGVVTVASYVQASEREGSFYIWIGAFVAGASLAIRSAVRIRAIREAEQPGLYEDKR